MVGAQHYENYSDFRRRVLEPAEKELREKASFYFDWGVGQKRGRSPVTLDLFFHRNKTVIEERKKQEREHPPLALPTNLAPGFVRKLLDAGISEEKVQELQREEDPDFLAWVADKIEASKAKPRKDAIRDHEKFSLAILEGERGNYRAETLAAEAQKQKQLEKQEASKPIVLQRIHDFLDKEMDSYVYELAEARLAKLSNPETEQEAFLESLEPSKIASNPHLRKVRNLFEEHGFDQKLVRATFVGFLIQYWKIREETSRQKMMTEKAYTIQESKENGVRLYQSEEDVLSMPSAQLEISQ